MNGEQKFIMGYQFARELSREELGKVSGGLAADKRTKVCTCDDNHCASETGTGDQ